MIVPTFGFRLVEACRMDPAKSHDAPNASTSLRLLRIGPTMCEYLGAPFIVGFRGYRYLLALAVGYEIREDDDPRGSDEDQNQYAQGFAEPWPRG